jgi:hypothetical protein
VTRLAFSRVRMAAPRPKDDRRAVTLRTYPEPILRRPLRPAAPRGPSGRYVVLPGPIFIRVILVALPIGMGEPGVGIIVMLASVLR